MAQAKKDNNSVSALIGVSSVDGVSTVPVAVDPTTGRLLVDLAGNGNLTIGTSTITGGTTGLLLYDNAGVVGELALATYPSLTELSYVKGVTSGIQTQLNAKGVGTVTGTGTQNEIAYWSNASALGTLAVATYPSLTELSYVKGVTSAIQSQFTGKAATGQTFYIGTTQVAINRASAALTLAGITLTTPDIGVATATSVNKVAFTAPTTAATFAFGTDNTTQTFQGTDTIVGRATTDTLTNKRITPRILSATTYTTNTGTSIASDSQDMFIVTAQAGNLLFNNPSGTPTDGQKFIISVASSTTAARALTWGNAYGATTVALPTTTAATTATLTIGFIWSASKTLWQCVAVA